MGSEAPGAPGLEKVDGSTPTTEPHQDNSPTEAPTSRISETVVELLGFSKKFEDLFYISSAFLSVSEMF